MRCFPARVTWRPATLDGTGGGGVNSLHGTAAGQVGRVGITLSEGVVLNPRPVSFCATVTFRDYYVLVVITEPGRRRPLPPPRCYQPPAPAPPAAWLSRARWPPRPGAQATAGALASHVPRPRNSTLFPDAPIGQQRRPDDVVKTPGLQRQRRPDDVVRDAEPARQ